MGIHSCLCGQFATDDMQTVVSALMQLSWDKGTIEEKTRESQKRLQAIFGDSGIGD
jgi:hypothetical protein